MPVIKDYPQFKCMVSMDWYVMIRQIKNSLLYFYIIAQNYIVANSFFQFFFSKKPEFYAGLNQIKV